MPVRNGIIIVSPFLLPTYGPAMRGSAYGRASHRNLRNLARKDLRCILTTTHRSPSRKELQAITKSMETALSENCLTEKGIIQPAEIRRQLRSSIREIRSSGAKVVARAWPDSGVP